MGIGILGGSFNPVHVGHLRLALEVLEAPAAALEYVDLLPCAEPPHKPQEGILPFELRAALLEVAVRHIPRLRVNRLEGLRSGPSYTWDTLTVYAAQYPGQRPLFILGGEDFATLPQWFRGLELPRLADFVVVPRAGAERGAFLRAAAALWPDAREAEAQFPGGARAVLPEGGQLLFLPLPRLDISASLIRERWLAGRDIHFLVPDAAVALLHAHRDVVAACWADTTPSTPCRPC